ncbi:Ger(x)C family spore germination protein [Bacillus sp. FJAT-49736]|uniref:Ger(x)C family spore germination protein n=1 Tax=Bacillus sp. FJAT-49736 TaxID=2833582 RepID=UPI001BC9895F|nr:Ger(x)C family spore germination protein [Bacillus sp. FJAT-49736]MBS4173974.1 Ger(x)C family spore germination protein [Bacillus sp. FJAT-49736]
MKKILILSSVLIFILSGCVQQEIIDKQNIETAVGFDLADGRIEGTVLYPTYNTDKSVTNNILVTEAKVSRDILEKLEKKSDQPLVTGSLQVVLFGKGLARRGFFHLIDSLQRDPNIGSRIHLAVVDGSTSSLLMGKYGSTGNGVYIKDLLDHNMKYLDVPRQNLHLFGAYLFEKGRTTYLPIIKQVNNSELEISGIALFNTKRMVMEIPPSKMFNFKLLVDRHTAGNQTVNLNKQQVVIRSINSSNSIKVNKKKKPYEIVVHINIEGIIREYTGEKIDNKIMDKFEKAFNKKIKRETTALLKDFQKRNIDPVGIGERVENVSRHFDWDKWWNSEYKNVTFKVKPKVSIVESGTVE